MRTAIFCLWLLVALCAIATTQAKIVPSNCLLLPGPKRAACMKNLRKHGYTIRCMKVRNGNKKHSSLKSLCRVVKKTRYRVKCRVAVHNGRFQRYCYRCRSYFHFGHWRRVCWRMKNHSKSVRRHKYVRKHNFVKCKYLVHREKLRKVCYRCRYVQKRGYFCEKLNSKIRTTLRRRRIGKSTFVTICRYIKYKGKYVKRCYRCQYRRFGKRIRRNCRKLSLITVQIARG